MYYNRNITVRGLLTDSGILANLSRYVRHRHVSHMRYRELSREIIQLPYKMALTTWP